MRKNQKYSKEEMYLAIEIWKESGLSIEKFCRKEELAVGTFKYWQLKYKKENKAQRTFPAKPFIPIEVSSSPVIQNSPSSNKQDVITITYPTGTEVSCPVNIGLGQLKLLIKL